MTEPLRSGCWRPPLTPRCEGLQWEHTLGGAASPTLRPDKPSMPTATAF